MNWTFLILLFACMFGALFIDVLIETIKENRTPRKGRPVKKERKAKAFQRDFSK